MNFRSSLACTSSDIARWGLRSVLKRQGGVLPGRIAMKIDPELLSDLAGLVDRSVVITGTNGKTTTSNLIADAVAASGATVVCNRAGNNMEPGVVGALLEARSGLKRAASGKRVGVICKKDGTTVDINIGDKADDPVFTISDLLIHLSSEQMAKPAKDAVDAEILDVIVGGRPVKFDEDDKDAPKEPVKQMFLDILKEQYDVEEEDFLSAEIEVVPAGPARDMGLDRSMILGYGHDDRVCAYPSMLAQINVTNVERTSITLIVDKEEIGSVGATGMTSRFFENTVAEIMTLAGEDSPLVLRRALAHSRMLSSDVSAGFDPGYAGKFETKNAAFMGRGLCFNKYTGSRGKGGSNDADAEYVALVRDIMDEAGVDFQTCELGRVNAGGGGTIAYIMAKYGMNVIDSGVAVLSMHALWEVANKADIYEAYRGYKAFIERA